MARFLLCLASAALAVCAYGTSSHQNAVNQVGFPTPLSGFTGPSTPVGKIFTMNSFGAAVLNDPVVDGAGNVYLSLSFGNVYGINGQTGSVMWTYHSNDGSGLGNCVVSLDGTQIYVGTTKGVFALSSSTGNLLWYWTDGLVMTLTSNILLDPSLSVSGAVFVTGRGTGVGGSVTALNAITGNIEWTTVSVGSTFANWVIGHGQIIVATPGILVYGGSVQVTAYDGVTGNQAWNKLIATSALYTLFMFQNDAAGNVYIGYSAGTSAVIQALKPASNGAIYWTVNQNISNPFATIGLQNVYIADSQGITAFNLATGTKEWAVPQGISNLELPIMAIPSHYCYVVTGGLTSVRLSALDATTGDVIWTFNDPQRAGVFGAPVFDALGTLYIETFSSVAGSTVYALNPTTGAVIWQYGIAEDKTVLYDTALVIGAGRLFVGDSDSFIGVGYVSPSTSGGTVAGAVIGTLLAVGILGGAVWYWKVKLGGDLSSLKARLGFANGGASGYAVGNGTSGGFATGSSTGGYNASGKTAYTYESL